MDQRPSHSQLLWLPFFVYSWYSLCIRVGVGLGTRLGGCGDRNGLLPFHRVLAAAVFYTDA